MSFHLPRIGPALCALSAGILALTDESSAQVMPQQNSRTLSAAMAEVGRSPFHARDPVNRSMMNARPAPQRDPAALFGEGTQTRGRFNETVEDPQAASDRAASTASLIWSTALGTVAGDLLAYQVVSSLEAPEGPILYGTLSAPVAALAATGLGGAHFGWALLGSSLGLATGVGAGLLVVTALDDALDMAALLPAFATYFVVRVAVAVATVKLAGR